MMALQPPDDQPSNVAPFVSATWKERAGRLESAFRDAHTNADSPYRDLRKQPVRKDELQALWRTALDWTSCLERRIRLLERQLQAALACDALGDQQRARIIRALSGSTTRDAKLLKSFELHIVEQYRATDSKGKAMFRALLERLAATSRRRPRKRRERTPVVADMPVEHRPRNIGRPVIDIDDSDGDAS